MKRIFRVFSLLMVLALLAASTGTASALWLTNGHTATLVLGQTNFTSKANQTTQKGMWGPQGVAVDTLSGKVYVADSINNRVLRFGSLASISSGAAAEAVFGQPNFTSKTAATTQSGMNFPTSVAVDSLGGLWVADITNNRVLHFNNASTLLSGANADSVLGQANFMSSASGAGPNRMFGPSALVVDNSSGRLWVADEYNSRVLRFDSAVFKSNGANADGVLGQSNFVNTASGTTQNTMNIPKGLVIDSSGHLWVADYHNNRVLRFDNAASKANGVNADGVLGQADFTSSIASTTQSGMNRPIGLALDSTGKLWVADSNNNRILAFSSSAALSSGSNASSVLGQVNYTSAVSVTTASGLDSPTELAYDASGDSLWVADSSNGRVLRYSIVTLSKNGSFDTYTGASKIPAGWTAASFATIDGKNTAFKKDGTASVKITGQTGKTKTLKQILAIGGKSGDALAFSFWVKGSAIPAAGLCQGQVLLYSGTTLKKTQTLPCGTGTFGFKQKLFTFPANSAYTQVVIKFTYSKASGSVWFDAVSLMR